MRRWFCIVPLLFVLFASHAWSADSTAAGGDGSTPASPGATRAARVQGDAASAPGSPGATLPSAVALPGGRLEVRCSLSRDRMYIGDVVKLKVEAECPPGVNVDLDSAGAVLSSAGFEIRDFSRSSTRKGDRTVQSYVFDISTFTLGDYRIPPIPVRYVTVDGRSGVVATPPLVLKVEPVPRRKGDEKGGLRPPKPRVRILSRTWLWYCLLLALAALLGWWLLRRFASRGLEEEEDESVVIPPHEEAAARLRKLKEMFESGRVGVKDACYLLTEIMRRYFERRFGFRVLSSTTGEFLEAMRAEVARRAPSRRRRAGAAKLDPHRPGDGTERAEDPGGRLFFSREFLERLESFMEDCDMVKYAKAEMQAEGFERLWREAMSMVGETAPRCDESGEGRDDEEVSDR